MAIKNRPLTKSQLVGYFQDYREAFPDWEVEHDVVLSRRQGPIKQMIGFQALRSGAYRTSCWVAVQGTIEHCNVLNQWLDIKHRDILPHEHLAKRPLVLRAMEEQFLPSICKPLDIGEVLQLAEEEVIRDKINKTNYSVALAALNAHVGNFDRAMWWCDQVPVQLANLGREPADWERVHEGYAKQLREAILCGRVGPFLQANLGS